MRDVGAFAQRCDLWLAEWTEGTPAIAHPWTDWAAWQWCAKGSVPGIVGEVDLSWLKLPTAS